MDFDWIWKAILIVIAGTILLRFAGRKSISQMTLPQTVIMIGIGSLLIQPVSDKSLWVTFGVGAVLVLTLILIEYSELKGNFFETFLTGKSKVLIHNGTINEKNLRKVRLTVDQLEANLRQKNVRTLSDVEYATLEPNGQLGYILKQEAQPVTKKEFQQLIDLMHSWLTAHQDIAEFSKQVKEITQQFESLKLQDNLFTEVTNNSHDKQVPKHLK
ncbi:DUF421 domain-containing protein [Ornithinibacillus scapharcae]|uniref:DUF421 domain-containing protein n=1 Tax=Ornithinibacillus scapharcae TaxID=1147159 RepID=UPI000225B670|nr:DUF421 domain-containing protein [Ornithinibacillus scapharcae]